VADVPEPVEALGLDPSTTGLVDVLPDGRVRGSWGLAARLAEFRVGTDVRSGPFGAALALLAASARHGSVRALGTPEDGGWRLLVVDGEAERVAQERGERLGRLAQGLKRLGKALSMNQNLGPLCVAAVHEIAATAELAAVLIWRHVPETGAMELAASVGVTRPGVAALSRLAPEGEARCAAEMVAAGRRPFYTASVLDHALTGEVEGRYCYLDPGGVRSLPLEISGRLLGVIELVGRRGDDRFEEDEELHRTVSEHLALALNGATLYENLERLASHDPLTGLANHRALQDFLHLRIVECDRTGGSLGCIMIDVDHFRNFNEEEGHDAGDEALRQVAQALKGTVRPYDLAARYGGEEFTVLVPGASPTGVRTLAERLRARVAERPFVTLSGREVPLTVSVGCAVYPAQGPDAPGLLKAADVALYEAKRGGRNQVAGPGLEESAAMADLRAVLGDGAYEAGAARLEQLAPDLDGVSLALRLTANERAEMEALIVVSKAWEEYSEPLRDEPSLARLIPALDAIARPHRPEMPEPVATRLLQALLAKDDSMADPEVAAMLEKLRDM